MEQKRLDLRSLWPALPNLSTVKYELTPLILDHVMGRRSLSLTFRYVDEDLWCYHANETSLADVLRCTISFVRFYK